MSRRNHMDIIGKEALEQMLREYEGTVLFVSHDRYFISRIATGILEFSGDAVRQYAMNYEEYLAEKQKCAGGVAAECGKRRGRNAGSAAGQGSRCEGTADAGSVPTLSDVLTRRPITIRARCAHGCSVRRKSMSGCLRRAREAGGTSDADVRSGACSDYPKLMELQSAVDAEEANQDISGADA